MTRAARTVLPRLTDRLPLGNDGLRVSPYCLGLTADAATICAAYDAGVNFFFLTADMHWPLYEKTRRGLTELLSRGGSIRDQIVVAGVCYPTQPEFCSAPFLELVEAVPELKRVDVLLAGGAYGYEFDRRVPIFDEHRRSGFCGNRAIGATFHDRSAAVEAICERQIDIGYIRYNPGHSGARNDVFPHVCERPRPLLFGFKSTFGYVSPARMEELGLPAPDCWHPAITDHYRFALTPPEMDGLLMGLRTPSQVDALCAGLEKGPLSEEQEDYLLGIVSVIRGEAQVLQEC